ncbi:subtilisin-like protease SBT2.4 [Tanacetum coccineum]
MGFVLIANPMYGDFLTEPLPFSIPGIMIPKTSDSKIILDYYEKQTERDSNGVVTAFRGRAAIGEGRFGNYNLKAPIVSRFSSRGPNFMDIKRNPTDLLKPDILAPGRQIWAAWSPMSVKLPILSGQSFGLMSGTSMAAPHVAGVAALIKQRNPSWSPSMIASAMATTAFTYDNRGEPIMAHSQDIYTLNLSWARLPKPTDPEIIKTTIGEQCAHSFQAPSDLNIPSLTISALNGKQLVRRTVKNVADTAETYVCAVVQPNGVAVELNPPWFNIAPEGTQDLEVILKVTQVQDSFSYGEIVLNGEIMKHIYLDAALLAGLKPLKLIHDGTAIALAYGMHKTDFSDSGSTNVIFVDIGHCDTHCDTY